MDGRKYLCKFKFSKQIDSMSLFFLRNVFLCFLLLFLANRFVYSEIYDKVDSTKIINIQEVIIAKKHLNSELRSTAPIQIIKNTGQINALQVSDAIKCLAGVTVKDFGGIGGLKTVSVRSLGGNHTAVSYDGITLNDCQTGQIDLSRFSLDNVELISLNNGQSDNIFQPARLFASASVLNIKTLTPVFKVDKTLNGKFTMNYGSFGLLNPSVLLEAKINNKFSVSLNSEWLKADGNYPYLLQNGTNSNYQTSNYIRQNTDVHNFRFESTVYANFSKTETAYLKGYYYQSERGLPGPTILYNTESSSKQRIWDYTFFSQAHYEKEFSKFWNFQGNVKYNNGNLRYLDPTYQNSDGKLENSYRQTEYYGSAALLFKATDNVSFSASTDGSIALLSDNLTDFAYPQRYSWLSVVAAKYVDNSVLVTASLLSTVVAETVLNGKASNYQPQLSPYISFSIKPFDTEDLRIRGFYKNIFRLPSFNDLYYSQVGNRNLQPEKTNQINVGFTYFKCLNKCIPQFSITTDLYHNDVIDKIVAFPNKDTFFWTILNYGKVAIDGLDLTAETKFQPWNTVGIVLGANYSYQRALIVTDPTSRDYNNQIPYTPRISGSGKMGVETAWINFSYSVLWSGHRYSSSQNYIENRLPAYFDHSISMYRTVQINQFTIFAKLEVLNLTDQNYEIVRWFPMPGRSFRATISIKY